MLYKSSEGKNIEIMRTNFKNDEAYYHAILKAKGFIQKSE